MEEFRSKVRKAMESTDLGMAKFVLEESPYHGKQKTRYYLDTLTGDCFYCHVTDKVKTNGKFWGYKKS